MEWYMMPRAITFYYKQHRMDGQPRGLTFSLDRFTALFIIYSQNLWNTVEWRRAGWMDGWFA